MNKKKGIIDIIKGIEHDVRHASTELLEVCELGVDYLIGSDVLDDIPVISSIKALFDAKDKFSIVKIKRNYSQLVSSTQGMDQNAVKYLISTLTAGTEKADEAAETILDIISNSERPLKAEILGNLIMALSSKQIEIDDFNTLLHILRASSIPAIRALKTFLEENDNKSGIQDAMGGNKQESLLMSIGAIKRHGTALHLSEWGAALAFYGLRIAVKNFKN